MKRIAGIVAVTLLLAGCAMQKEVTGYDYYDRLESPLKAAYRAVESAIADSQREDCVIPFEDGDSWGITVPFPCPLSCEQDVTQVYTAVTRDHPEFFFIGDRYGYDQNERGQYVSLTIPYFMNAEERRIAAERLETAVQQLLPSIPYDDEFEQELAVHDAFLNVCRYTADKTAASCSVYGALIEGRAVCEGYAKGLQYLLRRGGIQATVMTGFNDADEPHMWTVATVNGKRYHIDPTANDDSPIPHHTYFNVNDDQLAKVYHFDRTVICDGENDNYFVKRGYVTDSLRTETVAVLLAKQLKCAPLAELQFTTTDSFENARVFVQNVPWLTETIRAHTGQNESYTVRWDIVYHTVYIGKKSKENS